MGWKLIIAAFIAFLAFQIVFTIRNNMVYEFRMRILDASKRVGPMKFYPYSEMPDYNTMMRRWWIWDFNKFLPSGPGPEGVIREG